MTTSYSAQVYIKNNTGGNAFIQMSHQYGSNPVEVGSWTAGPGDTVGPLVVNYETGIATSFDYWLCTADVKDGPNPGNYQSGQGSAGDIMHPNKECMLESSDSGKQITNTVDTQKFHINLPSGGCSSSMNRSGHYSLLTNIFVLMLENHSFDHLFGFSGLPGVVGLSGSESNTYNNTKYTVSSSVTDPMPLGPGHEFMNTMTQLCGDDTANPFPKGPYPPINNSGFVADYANEGASSSEYGDVMNCCDSPNAVPVLYQLAQEFAICDNWFSSMPGPTWPNRLFAMGGSSAGLDDSPTNQEVLGWETVTGFTYQNGSIFDLLRSKNLTYKLFADFTNAFAAHPNYAGGEFPIAAALHNIALTEIISFDLFNGQLTNPGAYGTYYQPFTWIEPNYGDAMGDFHGGSSQHPTDSLAAGEAMIAAAYNAVRNSPHWNTSMLIITYDEHGGFYDHVRPPAAIEPGDSQYKGLNTNGFDFQQYGVRVPAVVISPLISKGTVDHTLYDHTSILKTVEDNYSLGSHLTLRVAKANDLLGLTTLGSARADCPQSITAPTPAPAPSTVNSLVETPNMEELDARPLPESGNLIGFLHIALKAEVDMSDGSDASKQAIIDNFKANVKTYGDARDYFARISAEVQAVRESKQASMPDEQ
jgi:phospholipase C